MSASIGKAVSFMFWMAASSCSRDGLTSGVGGWPLAVIACDERFVFLAGHAAALLGVKLQPAGQRANER